MKRMKTSKYAKLLAGLAVFLLPGGSVIIAAALLRGLYQKRKSRKNTKPTGEDQ